MCIIRHILRSRKFQAGMFLTSLRLRIPKRSPELLLLPDRPDFPTFLSVLSMPTAPSSSVGTVAAYGWRSPTVRSHSSADGSDRDTRRIRIPYGGRYRYSLPEPYRAQYRAVVLLQYRCTHTHSRALPTGRQRAQSASALYGVPMD